MGDTAASSGKLFAECAIAFVPSGSLTPKTIGEVRFPWS